MFTNNTINAKINEVKKEIPSSITNLATAIAFAALENKRPNVSNLIKKTDYKTNFSEIGNKITTDRDHDKYITTQELNKLTSKNVTGGLAQANIVKKT